MRRCGTRGPAPSRSNSRGTGNCVVARDSIQTGRGSVTVVPTVSVSAKVGDARTSTPLLELKGHTNLVSSVSFSPDGARIVTGSFDGTAKVWDARTGTPLLDLKGNRYPVISVSFSADGARIVTGN